MKTTIRWKRGTYMFSIGKLAKMSNITVRTLRYYDEIGLLKPTETRDGGHRYYNEGMLAKLHNIMMLKEMGFELETIHGILDDQVKSSKELLSIRLEIIKEEQAQLKSMEKRIHEIIQLMELGGTNDWQAIFNTISKQYNRPENMNTIRSRYFTAEELEAVNNLPKVGGNKETKKWINLLNEVRENMDKAPSSPIAQTLAEKWMDLTREMYKGDLELAHKAWNINKKNDIGFYDFDSEIVAYMEKAVTYYYCQITKAGEHHE